MKIESFSTPPLKENLSRLAEYLDSTGEDEGAGLVREAITALSAAPVGPQPSGTVDPLDD